MGRFYKIGEASFSHQGTFTDSMETNRITVFRCPKCRCEISMESPIDEGKKQ